MWKLNKRFAISSCCIITLIAALLILRQTNTFFLMGDKGYSNYRRHLDNNTSKFSVRNCGASCKTQFNGDVSSGSDKFFSNLALLQKGSEFVQNLPPAIFIVGGNKKGPQFLGNNTCALFPTVYRLKFSNIIWQVQREHAWTFYAFGAYWDVREANKEAPSIRILGMMDRSDENITTKYCQIWFRNKKQPIITEVTQYASPWAKGWGYYKEVGELHPFLMNCPMPKNYSGPVPTSVSVVSSPCVNATNNIRVHLDKPPKTKKKMFAVCVKGLDFLDPNWAFRLVEWIELLGILGVDKIFFYELAVHSNTKKVLKYYQDANKVQVLPLTYPGDIPNEPFIRHAFLQTLMVRKKQNELIPYNDCIYRNMYKYKYISLLDVDEIIIPHRGKSWPEFVSYLEQNNTKDYNPYFIFKNVAFFRDDDIYSEKETQNIPNYLYMLRHTTRSSAAAENGSGIKCFHRPDEILAVHNHFVRECIGNCTRKYVNEEDGYLHHYRPSAALKINGTFTLDEHLWIWKEELIYRSNKVILKLGLIS